MVITYIINYYISYNENRTAFASSCITTIGYDHLKFTNSLINVFKYINIIKLLN